MNAEGVVANESDVPPTVLPSSGERDVVSEKPGAEAPSRADASNDEDDVSNVS